VGTAAAGPAVQRLGDLAAAGVQDRGYELLGTRSASNGAGIVSFRKAGLEADAIVQKLRSAGVTAASRQGWGRVSPHFYISPDEIGRMIEALP
jgi:cysteine desulfurase/selenocysteine lyase